MDSLKSYLNSMPRSDQEDFACKCRTSLGYLRKAISAKQKLGVELVVRLHKNSNGLVSATSIRPDVDWSEFNAVLYPANPDDLTPRFATSDPIEPIVESQDTHFSGGGCLYSAAEEERRRKERRLAERRDHERREDERRQAS